MKKVFKYGTGFVIPEGAIFLSTQVETNTTSTPHVTFRGEEDGSRDIITRNKYVWHYFLVEVPDSEHDKLDDKEKK